MEYNHLTPEEKRVIENKGTERPFSGEYDKFAGDGVYICRRCNAPLYDSKDKFDAHCGWPSFDDEIRGAVKRETDADGVRTEITCANCEAHLGHVFTGEKMTAKDTRHCVNSISMRFIPRKFKAGETRSAVFGGGCFWCLDAVFRGLNGVISVIAGYAGGHTLNPTYGEVSGGATGHAETVKIEFDTDMIKFRDLLEIFFTIHNPTTLNRQGNDVGEQYRSIILYQTWGQKIEADKIIRELEYDEVFDHKIVTEVRPLVKFYPAEDYHQDYFNKNPEAGYCQAIIAPKLKKFREKYAALVRDGE